MAQTFPELLRDPFLLACSGGLDSMVLAHMCHALQLNFALGHCNFQLRGPSSEGDEALVRQLGRSWNIRCFATRFETQRHLENHGGSLQVVARDLRYRWFQEVLENENLHYVVTAHHANDRLETFLINLSRGTGLEGLSGIPEKRQAIRRPLLPFSRADILKYAQAHNIPWREDSSNTDTKYLRNKIRHEIVPKLHELHPSFLHNFAQTQNRLGALEIILENHLSDVRKEVFKQKGGLVHISIDALSPLRPLDTYLYYLLKDYGFTAWKDVKSLLNGMSGKEVRSKTHRLVKHREVLLLSPLGDRSRDTFPIFRENHLIQHPIILDIQKVDKIGEQGKNILYVDKETLKYPLLLRKWGKGDYFYPMGMQGRKKLAKYFKDEKLSVIAKEEQWLLCSGEDIVWVIGRRPDERFKVSPKTREILKFETSL
ncbi:MAG: tRNA lysidine(34) synthetase TilS [Bacteroidota bacterium]